MSGREEREMKLLVCGNRDLASPTWALAKLTEFTDGHGVPDRVIHGDARGADKFGHYWAGLMGITSTPVPALWEVYGKSAGPKRNQVMLEMLEPGDHVVALICRDLERTGTADMVGRARNAGYPVTIYDIRER